MSHHWLAWTYQVAGYLGDCVGIYFASLVVWTLLKGRRPQHAKKLMNYVKRLKNFREGGFLSLRQGMAFATFCLAALLLGAKQMDSAPIVTEHNIRVISRVGDHQWYMMSDEEGGFLYAACHDFPNDTVIWAGYIADHAIWKEYGSCKSIRDTGLGFWWKRDSNRNVERIK